MTWQLNDSTPIYLQLIEHLKTQIISAEYAAGEKLPSVRELAQMAAVNPNTMQRALAELETVGLVTTQRTAGRFVTQDEEKLAQMKLAVARDIMGNFLLSMGNLGNSPQMSVAMLQKYMEEEKQHG